MSITITNQAKPLLQRTTAGTGTAVVAGTYTGSPTSIDARILKVVDDSEVVTWTQIVASPAAGTYTANFTSIPESASGDGGYYVAVRANGTGDTANTKGVWEFQVGRFAGLLGQSNCEKMGSVTNGSPPSAAVGTYYYSGSAWAAIPSANGLRNLANDLVTRTGVPWGIIIHGVSGVDRSYFDDGATGYTAFMSKVTGGPNDLELLIWLHGEAAAVGVGTDGTSNNRLPVPYADALNVTHVAIADDLGRTVSQLPMFVCSLARETTATYGSMPWHRAQLCCWYAAQKYANIHYTHSEIGRSGNVSQSLAAGEVRMFRLTRDGWANGDNLVLLPSGQSASLLVGVVKLR